MFEQNYQEQNQERDYEDQCPQLGDIAVEQEHSCYLEGIMQNKTLIETGDRIIKDTLARIADGDKHPGIPIFYKN